MIPSFSLCRSFPILSMILFASAVLAHPAAAEPFAYIAQFSSASVAVVDLGQEPGVVVATVNVGDSPFGVAVAPQGDRAYVTNSGDDTLSVLDLTQNPALVIHTVGVGAEPNGVVVSPDGEQVFVANYSANTVSVIDATLAVPAVIATLPVGQEPEGLAINADGSRVYVGNTEDLVATVSVISVIDAILEPPAVIDSIDVDPEPHGMAVAPDGRLYVATADRHRATIIDTATNSVEDTVQAGDRPYMMAISPLGDRAYVSNPDVGTISVLDLTVDPPTITETIPAGTLVFGLRTSADGTRLYSVSAGNQSMTLFDISQSPAVSLGSTPLEALPIAYGDFISPLSSRIFSDGFESGDTSFWSP